MPKVLVVDDSTVDRRLTAGLLTRAGEWQVEQARDGAEALRMVRESQPDLVVTDMTMPELDGLALVRELTRDFPRVPVILMTALGSEAIAVEALQSGAASYVPKKRLALDLVEVVQRVTSAAAEARIQSKLCERVDSLECRFTFSNDVQELLALPAHILRLVDTCGWDSSAERIRISVALEEALLNAMYHGNLEVDSSLKQTRPEAFYELADQRKLLPPYDDRKIHVRVRFTPEEAQYVIRDEGKGFDPATIPDPTDPANLDREFGRGLLLMQTFMDEVRYNDRGNEVTLIKRRTPAA